MDLKAKIYVNNIHSVLECNKPSVVSKLDEHLSVNAHNRFYSHSYRSGIWDGKYHFYNRITNTFLTGLLDKVIEFFKDRYYYKPEIVDKRNEPTQKQIPVELPLQLRRYQVEAVEKVLKHKRGILKMATNSGKTVVGAEIVRRLGLNTVWIVHRKELMYQTQKVVSELLKIDVGIIGDGVVEPKDVTVVMATTAIKDKKVTTEASKILNSELLIYDECHTIGDSRIETLVKSLKKAYYRVAMSGTPLHNTEELNMKLIGYFGEIIHEVTNQDLIQMEVSAKPIVYFVEINNEGISQLSYGSAYKYGIVLNSKRNSKIVEIAKESFMNKLTALIIVREIAHGELLKEEISKFCKCEFTSGQHSTEHRKNCLELLRNKKIDVLVSSTILDEGVDIPAIQVLILGAGQKTPKRLLQRIGRGLRKKEFNKLFVFDFVDNGNRYLLSHTLERVKTCKDEDFFTKKVVDIKHDIKQILGGQHEHNEHWDVY